MLGVGMGILTLPYKVAAIRLSMWNAKPFHALRTRTYLKP